MGLEKGIVIYNSEANKFVFEKRRYVEWDGGGNEY